MTAEELLERMRAVLAEEREAIRRLDATAVVRAASTKEALLEGVESAPTPERAALIAAVGLLRPELQQNLSLLAHVRRYLREATDVCARPARRVRLEAEL